MHTVSEFDGEQGLRGQHQFWDLASGVRVTMPIESEPSWTELVQLHGSVPLIWNDDLRATFHRYFETIVKPDLIWSKPSPNSTPRLDQSKPLVYPADGWFLSNGAAFAFPTSRGRPLGAWYFADWPGKERLMATPASPYYPDGLAIDDIATGARLNSNPLLGTPFTYSWSGGSFRPFRGAISHFAEVGVAVFWGEWRNPEDFWGFLRLREPPPWFAFKDPYEPFVLSYLQDRQHFVEVETGGCVRSACIRWWNKIGGESLGAVRTCAGSYAISGNMLAVSLPIQKDDTSENPGVLFWRLPESEPVGEWTAQDSATKIRPNQAIWITEAGDRIAVPCLVNTGGNVGIGPNPRSEFLCSIISSVIPSAEPTEVMVVVDSNTHKEVGRYPGAECLLSPDGKTIVTLDANGMIAVWDLGPPKPNWWQLILSAIVASIASAIFLTATALLVRWLRFAHCRFFRRNNCS